MAARDGAGRIWRRGVTVAADSTPRRPVRSLGHAKDPGVARGRHLVTPESLALSRGGGEV